MIWYEKKDLFSTTLSIIVIVSMFFIAIIPAESAIDQRGPLIDLTAGQNTTLNGENCPGFYYSASSGTYYESLDLYFSEDGLIEAGNATYTSKITLGSTAFFGKKYKVLEDGLLSENLVSYGSRDLQQGNDFNLGNGYELILKGLNGDFALLELQKDSIPITTEALKEGSKFNFTTRIEGTEYVILEGTLDRVLDGKDSIVSLSSVNQYSDSPLRIKVGDQYGKFEVTNLTSKKIELKNRVPIRMQPGDYVTILDNLIDLRVADDTYEACSYNMTKNTIKSYEIRGKSITVNRSDALPDSCAWTADSFGMLFYDPEHNLSTEKLELNLDAKNKWIAKGDLIYESSPVTVPFKNPEMLDYRKDEFNGSYSILGWDGEKYAYLGIDQGIINILMDNEENKVLYPGDEWDLKEGYTLNVNGIKADNVYLSISRNNLSVYSSIISPGKAADLGKHTLLYTKNVNGIEVPLFSVYVESVMEGSEISGVKLNYPLHFSENPLDVSYGKTFGELTVVESSPKLRLENKHDINLDSKIEVTEEILIGSFEKTTGGNVNLTFYPYMNKVEDVDSMLPTTSQWSIPAMCIEEYLFQE